MGADDENLISVMNSFREFYPEMMEDNDRAVVIVGTASIDFLLRRLIEKSLLPRLKKEDELLDSDSPLCSFSSKINLCYRLGIIDKEFSQLLHTLRRIRNDFAHKVKDCDLNSPPYSDQVRELSKHLKDSQLLIKLRNFFPTNGQKMYSCDFRIVLSLLMSLLEMKLRYMPKTMKANPISISWIPQNVSV